MKNAMNHGVMIHNIKGNKLGKEYNPLSVHCIKKADTITYQQLKIGV